MFPGFLFISIFRYDNCCFNFKVYFAKYFVIALSHTCLIRILPVFSLHKTYSGPLTVRPNRKKNKTQLTPFSIVSLQKSDRVRHFESLAIAVKIQLEHKSNQYESNFFGSFGYLAKTPTPNAWQHFVGHLQLDVGRRNAAGNLSSHQNAIFFFGSVNGKNSATIWLTG